MEQAVDIATARSEAGRLAARHDATDGDGIREDASLQSLLSQIDVADLVDLVDGLKTTDGDSRSIALYRSWLALSQHKTTQVFAAWYNLGVQLVASGVQAEAATAFGNALTARPDLNAAAVNAGLCHESLGDPEGALQIWRKALQPDQDRAVLLNHRGRLLEQLKRYEEAESSLRASLLTDPRQPDVIHHWTGIRAKTCSWPVFDDLPGLTRDDLMEASGALSRLALSDDIASNSRANAAWMERKFPPPQPRLSPETGYAHRKLRIGYLSSDFCMHPMAYLVADLFEEHDRDSFTIYGYCSTKDDGSDVRRRVLAAFDHVTPILDMTDEAVARKIRADEIDILIELNGLTLGTRLPVLRWRPAPVQVTYLGYNGPMPSDDLDYIIADRTVIPPEIAETHRPKPLYLSRCFQANDRKLPVGPRGTRAEAGLPDAAFVFCCFSNTYKITEDVFEAWTVILRRTENTVLWVYADNEPARRNMERRFAATGLDPARLLFAARANPELYRARLALADLFLDTFPYNAGTTASDALRVGLPVVTLSGRSFVSRMAASLLEAVGLADGITGSLEAYIDLAVALATEPDRYRVFRAGLDRDAWARTLGDTPAFTRDLEAALKLVAVVAPESAGPARTSAGVATPSNAGRLDPASPDRGPGSLRIFVASHLPGEVPVEPLYRLVQTGAAGTAPWEGSLQDDTGDQISSRNPTYSELTALYWLWKNTSDPRVGLCHYRRFLSPILFPTENSKGAKLDRGLAQTILNLDPNGTIFDAELSLADMVVPARDPRPISAAAHYASCHRVDDWQAMMSAMNALYPTEATGAEKYFSEIHPFHYYNMMITHRPVLDQYCSWLFPLLFHTETLIEPAVDRYQARVHGFLAERLFNWWTASRGLRLVERPIIQIA